MDEHQGGWEWVVKIIKEWTEVLTGQHFFFLGADGALAKVVHGITTGDNNAERWAVAAGLIAASCNTSEDEVVRNLSQTLKWGAKEIGSLTITPKDVLQAQLVTIHEFYDMSQSASPSQAGKFGFLYCEWEPAGPRITEQSDPVEEFSPTPGPAPKSPRRPTPEPLTDMPQPEDYEMASAPGADDSSDEEEDEADEAEELENPGHTLLDDLSEAEDEEPRRRSKRNDMTPIDETYAVNGYLVKKAITTVHAFYEELLLEKITGVMDRGDRTNRRLMKALRRMADGAAEAWNIGVTTKDDGEGALDRFPTDESSLIRKSLERTEKMVEGLHAKAGLSTKKSKAKAEAEARKQKKAEEEGAAKKRARSWAQKLEKIVSPPSSRPPSPTVEDSPEEGAVPKKTSPRIRTLAVIRSLPNPTPENARTGKTPGIKWIEKEITRLYDGRVIKVIDLIQERDGERRIVMEIPEPMETKDFEKDIPGVFLRMFSDAKEVFWNKDTWKLVVHRVPFEGRETPAALRQKILEENGGIDMPPRIIQRIVNKGLKQKETPIIIELTRRDEAIKIAREGLVVNGKVHTAEPYRPTKKTPPPSKKNESHKDTKCFNCGSKDHFISQCKKEIVETRSCNKCQKKGHLARACKGNDKPRQGGGSKGNTPKGSSTKTQFPCHKCNEVGHFRKNCPANSGRKAGNEGKKNGESKGKGRANETNSGKQTAKPAEVSDWDATRNTHHKQNTNRGSRADGWSAGEEPKNLW